MTPLPDNVDEFPRMGKGWQVYMSSAKPEVADSDPVEQLVAGEDPLVGFDCVCNPATMATPGWEAMPYDIRFEKDGSHTIACTRCGRLYKLQMAWRVLVYVPLALRFPKKTKDARVEDEDYEEQSG